MGNTDPATRINEIKKEKKDLIKRGKASNSEVEIRQISLQLDELNEELEEIRDSQEHEVRYTPQGQLNPIATYGFGYQNQQSNQRSAENREQFEQRANQFTSGKAVSFDINESEIRALTIGSGKVVTPTHSSNQLNQGFNEVSSLVDQVKSIPLQGGEAYKSGFIVSSGDADYTTEGADYYESDPKTDFVQINKAEITTYFEVSEQVAKLGGDYYLTFALGAARTAIRKKLAQQILVGTGGANSLVGIFKAPANVIPTTSDLTITAIDADTLDKIVFGYGGDESVEGNCSLILNKQTLSDFSKLRTASGDRYYKIKLDATGNAGTISSQDSFEVPFIINSAAKKFADATSGEFFMAYGRALAYEMPIFSGLDIQESRDFKFKSGQICIKGSVFAGGNVSSYKGFTRIKKA
ncbi:phage major capsid protein [Neobacillus sp.]|uniref:phage major capsid protein n=1 Tax=Neobacillus sp. TaxID=2675273 RepID=UPI0028A0E70B|nr:phage major capsid protein [Neobacillus sp.]